MRCDPMRPEVSPVLVDVHLYERSTAHQRAAEQVAAADACERGIRALFTSVARSTLGAAFMERR